MPGTLRSSSIASSPSRGGGCFLYVFCLFWTLISGTIFVLSTKTMLGNAGGDATQSWTPTVCVLERFEIRENEKGKDPRFVTDVAYRYSVDGKEFTGQKIWQKKDGSDHYRDLGKLREALLQGPEGEHPQVQGTHATCLVNPADPADAVLQSGHAPNDGGLWGGLIGMGVSGLFLLLGLMVFIYGRRAQKKNVSDVQSSSEGGGILVVFFLIFGLAGGGMAVWMGSQAVEAAAMKKWDAAQGTILSSSVRSHSGDDSTTYSIELFYRYEVAGKPYFGDRYNVMGGSSSGYDSKQAYVSDHPPDSALTIYYDPKDPWQSVAQREMGSQGWWLLFPLPFLAVGVFGLIWTFKKMREPKLASGAGSTGPGAAIKWKRPDKRSRGVAVTDPLLASGEWVRLRGTPVVAIVFLVVFALIWNGVTWGGLVDQTRGPRDWSDWFHLLFMVPFVVVGIAVVVVLFFAILGAGAASFEIMVDRAELAPGQSSRVSWRRVGGRGQPRNFTLLLVGKESATYSNGSSNSTDTSIFHETKLYETTSKLAMQAGQVELVIPADAVPGFEGTHNSIRWQVCVLYDMGRWRKYSPSARLTVALQPSSSNSL